jgi:hypothetical protein
MFLIFDGQRPVTWAAVQDESVWKSRFREAKFLKTQEGKDGRPTFDVVEFPGPRPEIVFQPDLSHHARRGEPVPT